MKCPNLGRAPLLLVTVASTLLSSLPAARADDMDPSEPSDLPPLITLPEREAAPPHAAREEGDNNEPDTREAPGDRSGVRCPTACARCARSSSCVP